MRNKVLGLLLGVLALCGSALAADEYKIDPCTLTLDSP